MISKFEKELKKIFSNKRIFGKMFVDLVFNSLFCLFMVMGCEVEVVFRCIVLRDFWIRFV